MKTQIIKKLRKNKKYILNKESKSLLKDNLYSSNINKKYLIMKYIFLSSILIFIFFIFALLILLKKIKEISFQKDIYEMFTNKRDVNLFLTNKTEYYYRERKKYFKGYNELNLVTIQDKLNYLTIHESPEYKSKIVDKIKLREYSKKILGKDICVPILKIYNNANEIKLDELPDKFVLKCNHGSGMNIFCKDKSQFDLEKSKKQLNEWLDINYGLGTAQFQYYYIKRKIFASPYLTDDIIDYKIFCFNGNPKYIAARKYDETEKLYFYNYYDFNWTLTDIEDNRNHYRTNPNFKFAKPKNLNLMYEYAAKLSEEFVFVRVDLYEINNKVYLGELTFAPSNVCMSFKDEAQRIFLGKLLDIRKIKPSLFNN